MANINYDLLKPVVVDELADNKPHIKTKMSLPFTEESRARFRAIIDEAKKKVEEEPDREYWYLCLVNPQNQMQYDRVTDATDARRIMSPIDEPDFVDAMVQSVCMQTIETAGLSHDTIFFNMMTAPMSLIATFEPINMHNSFVYAITSMMESQMAIITEK